MEFCKFPLTTVTKFLGTTSLKVDLNNNSDKYYVTSQDIPFQGKAVNINKYSTKI